MRAGKGGERLRLAEMLLSRGPGPHDEGSAEIVKQHMKAAERGAKVVADNVADYYFSLPDGKMASWDELPPFAPPWDEFWIEARTPKTLRATFPAPSWGISAFVEEDKRTMGAGGRVKKPHVGSPARAYEFTTRSLGGEAADAALLRHPRWALGVMTWMPCAFPPYAPRPVTSMMLWLDEDGRVCETSKGGLAEVTFPVAAGFDYENERLIRQTRDEAYHLSASLMLAVSFMHMKNVVVADLWRHPKERKAVRRLTGEGPVHFRTVVVDPDMDVRAAGKPGRGFGGARCMHLVRGHFATYTEERPLGRNRVVGTFWRSAHFRGDRARGLVVKDYDVNAPGRKGGREAGRATTPA